MGIFWLNKGMKPIYVRDLTPEEEAELEGGLRSASAFTVRRCQILLKSAREKLSAPEIAAHLYCSDQAVREAIHAFHERGLACMQEGSHAREDPDMAFDAESAQWLKDTVHQSPRNFGVERSVWRLKDLAQVAYDQGHTDRVVAPATISRTLERIGVNWQRAKHWITSPDPHYEAKKSDATG